MENWKDIDGYEDWYSISSLGRISKCDREVEVRCKRGHWFKLIPGGIIEPEVNKNGEFVVKLKKDNKTKTYLMEELMAKTFGKEATV